MPITLYIMIFFAIAVAACAVAIFMTNSKIKSLDKKLEHQYALLMKIAQILKTKQATNAVTENAELIYQDLLQSLIPIMAAIDVMPRNTSEHPLWRAIGGILDEYAKNPFVLEKLRRAIKLNPDVARNTNAFLARADRFLNHLNTTEPDGILGQTFTDGLLGQSIMFFGQAVRLACGE